MVGALLKDNRGLARVDKMTTDRIKKGWISNSGIIKSVVGLFTLARTDFADIELFRDELAFRLALELERVPSEETLRQRLDLIAKLNSRQTLLDYAMRDLLRKVESFGTASSVDTGMLKSVLSIQNAGRFLCAAGTRENQNDRNQAACRSSSCGRCDS